MARSKRAYVRHEVLHPSPHTTPEYRLWLAKQQLKLDQEKDHPTQEDHSDASDHGS